MNNIINILITTDEFYRFLVVMLIMTNASFLFASAFIRCGLKQFELSDGISSGQKEIIYNE